MVDREILIRLLNNLKFYLDELNKKKNVSLKEFAKNYDIQAIVERRLEEAIECCIDIGNHIISDENLRPANSYRDVFKVLNENKKVSKALSLVLSDFASFRNILVHEYAGIDSTIVYRKFKSSIKIFPQFVKSITTQLMI